ncbi:hypothetical protein GCM10010532_022390 [Dactylosporangium siamense]|uniref:Uncharacterized protein n=2 Tax=Dactylosporangium siamense TaxID=685454 RepID=A0A919UAA4_9ACTN|nr:hypothetical protein Dsi01nite_014790 [Dactylosporangium siamense]
MTACASIGSRGSSYATQVARAGSHRPAATPANTGSSIAFTKANAAGNRPNSIN